MVHNLAAGAVCSHLSTMNTRALGLVLVAAASLAAQQPRWLATWSFSNFAAPPAPRGDSIDRVPTYANRTLRQIVRVSVGGSELRLRLSNEYGDRPLVIGAAHVAVRDTASAIRAGTDRALTFGGASRVVLRPGAFVTSDPLRMTVAPLADLAVSLWIVDSIRAATRHPGSRQTNYVSAPGDLTAAAWFKADTVLQQWTWLAGVDVVNERAAGVIVAFGNSITDGTGSRPDSNSRWPDVLARRLMASGEPPRGVVNAGIAGNGVLSPIVGPSALNRFDRDALMQPGVTHVVLLEGINDLSRGSANRRDSVTAEDIIFGYKQLIARAHERGVAIIGCTLTPIGGLNSPSTPSADAKRTAVNTWIRNSNAFDGVIDFDAATRDPADPTRFLPAYDSGDHLHPNGAGYRRKPR